MDKTTITVIGTPVMADHFNIKLALSDCNFIHLKMSFDKERLHFDYPER